MRFGSKAFTSGRNAAVHRSLGAHLLAGGGVRFAVWAPRARSVSVVVEDGEPIRLVRQEPGIWVGTAPEAAHGDRYHYRIASHRGFTDKADPVGFFGEPAPGTASRVWDLAYAWGDATWMRQREKRTDEDPLSIYEVHVGSWRKGIGGYRSLAEPLARHVSDLGFTHVELMPITEHPYGGSWGYQTTGYFSPAARWGTPQDLMYLIDTLHQAGIGVIADWTPAHFAVDSHGLAGFDGTHLYEHSAKRGRHPDWGTYTFDYAKGEVRSFLISSAANLVDTYHFDGIRVDAVASMLYLDYSRSPGEWKPNRFGGNEDLDAVRFLRDFNRELCSRPGVLTCAEESSARPGVTHESGLGFTYKWDLGWMHDTLSYLQQRPKNRRQHHTKLTFRGLYQDSERFLLPLSHDEVVHGKGSLLNKVGRAGVDPLAQLRLLLAYQFAVPGAKLVFMGTELASVSEWDGDGELPWLEHNQGISRLIRDLALLYRDIPAVSFDWIDPDDAEHSLLSFTRGSGRHMLRWVFNFSAEPQADTDLDEGEWRRVLSTDYRRYGGTRSVSRRLPPLSASAWRRR